MNQREPHLVYSSLSRMATKDGVTVEVTSFQVMKKHTRNSNVPRPRKGREHSWMGEKWSLSGGENKGGAGLSCKSLDHRAITGTHCLAERASPVMHFFFTSQGNL